MNLQNILQNIGLTDKEAKVYLANLEIGTNVASEIAKKAKINRVTTYDILQKLSEKALVSKFTKNKLKYFTAIEPEELLRDFHQRVSQLETSLPELRRLKGDTQHPKIRYFEGIEGIKKIYEDTLTSQTEILNYSNSKEIRTHWPEYDQEYVAKRVAEKIFLRGISPQDEHGEKVASENDQYFRDIKLVPGEAYSFTNEINIYDNKVAIISFQDELIGTIIESPAIAETQRAIFNMAWSFASQDKLAIPASKPKNSPGKIKIQVPLKKELPSSAPLKDQISLF